MCGIAGAFSVPHTLDGRSIVGRIVASQASRGPDHDAIEALPGERTQAVFGHNRLAILDLNPRSNQPLWDVDRRLALVLNGEIYNYLELRSELQALGHRFITDGDSEVVLEAFKAWGPEACNRFVGMFAFAIYDTETEALWLVRDRFGVKPLYYHLTATSLVFGSTPRAIAAEAGLPPNLLYLARGLRYWVYETDEPTCAYEGVSAMAPGHVLRARVAPDGTLATELRPYYHLATRVEALREELAGCSDQALIGLVADRLESAITLRMRADVPVGVSLSGGLDSTTVATRVARLHPGVKGFTFGHPDAPASEAGQVMHVARATGIEMVWVWPDTRRVIDAFWETLEAQDTPFPSGSLVAQNLVFEAARAHGVKVVLGGQGGDEVFMGYHKYHVLRLRRLLHERRYGEALGFAAGLVPLLMAQVQGAGHYLRALGRYLPGEAPASPLRLPDVPFERLGGDPGQDGWTRQLADIQRYSIPSLLRYEDRNSLGHGVESRLPFMDYRVVELGLALPSGIKVRDGYGKWVLRQGVVQDVSPEILRMRAKRGFDVPMATWIHQGLGASIRTRLRERSDVLSLWLAPHTRLDEAFSDARLLDRPATLGEALTLVWLADRSAAQARVPAAR